VAFAGFPDETWAFLDGLEADNSKAYVDAHRSTYQSAIVAPSAALVDAIGPLLVERVHPDLRAESKVGRSLFRLNRDVRFSADKTPYKTHFDFIFWLEGDQPRSRPALLLRLTSDAVLVGAGRMIGRGPVLDAYRGAVADQASGAELVGIVDALLAAGCELSEPSRAKPPLPFPADHPRAELLRRDGFHLSRTTAQPAELSSAAFAGWCAAAYAPYRPLLDWLARLG